MKATEFVKKFGFESAAKVLKSAPVSATSYRVSENNQLGLGGLYGRVENINGCILSLCDLKQIVDAWELIDRFGGYDSVLNMINNPTCFGDSNFEIEIKLNESINLVEQCQ